MHGFALNINVDLKHFSFVNPCGFSDRRATSMSKILGSHVPMQEATNCLISHFYEVFDFPKISNRDFLFGSMLQRPLQS